MSAEIAIVALCGFGLAWSCWKAGIQRGSEKTVEMLHALKIITYDHKGDIKPNQFWQEETKDEE